jgi:mersacidin/lichenicidin family type 2 lantibiotic
MNTRNIIRAWKDEEYRLSLSDAERALLPAHPAGTIELTENDLAEVGGGIPPGGGGIPPGGGGIPPGLSLRSRGTHWRVQDGKPRKTQGIFCYSATKHRYTNMEKSLDRSW